MSTDQQTLEGDATPDDPNDANVPSESKTPEKGGNRKRLYAIGGAAVAFILGAVAIAEVAVPMIAGMSEKKSSFDSIRVIGATGSESSDKIEEYEIVGEVEYNISNRDDNESWSWLIPADAPIETMPFDTARSPSGPVHYCTRPEVEWLRQHAINVDKEPGSVTSFAVTLYNSADSGGSLPLGNIRFEGKEVPSVPLIPFQCPVGGMGASGAVQQKLLINVDGDEAVYGEVLEAMGNDVMPEGSPVTVNIAPGEVTVLTLTRHDSVDLQRRYEGRFLADVMDGSGNTVVIADNVIFKRDTADNFGIQYHGPTSNLLCSTPEASRQPCTPEETVEVLKKAMELYGRNG